MVSGQLPVAIGAKSFVGQGQLKIGVLALLNRKSFFPRQLPPLQQSSLYSSLAYPPLHRSGPISEGGNAGVTQ